MSIFIFLPMSNENFSLIFFSAIRNFACQLFYQPHSPSVNCVNSNKIYTMFYNNLPFKLNFSKWNRISLTWSSFAFSWSPPTNPSPCEFSVYTFFRSVCIWPDSELSGYFFFRSPCTIFSMNYSELHIHHKVSAFLHHSKMLIWNCVVFKYSCYFFWLDTHKKQKSLR